MRMRVNTAGHDVLATRVHHGGTWGGDQILANGGDLAVLGNDIGQVSAVRIDDGATTDEEGAH